MNRIEHFTEQEFRCLEMMNYPYATELSKAFAYLIEKPYQTINILLLAKLVNVDPSDLETYIDNITGDNGYINLISYRYETIDDYNPYEESIELDDPDFDNKMYNYNIIVECDYDNIEEQLNHAVNKLSRK